MAQIQSELSAIINQFAFAIVARVHQNLGATFSNEACDRKHYSGHWLIGVRQKTVQWSWAYRCIA